MFWLSIPKRPIAPFVGGDKELTIYDRWTSASLSVSEISDLGAVARAGAKLRACLRGGIAVLSYLADIPLSPRHSIAFINTGGEVHTGNVVLLPQTGTSQVGGEIALPAENGSSYIIEVEGVEKISNMIDPGHETTQT